MQLSRSEAKVLNQLENIIIITDPDGYETVVTLYPSQIDEIEDFVDGYGYEIEDAILAVS